MFFPPKWGIFSFLARAPVPFPSWDFAEAVPGILPPLAPCNVTLQILAQIKKPYIYIPTHTCTCTCTRTHACTTASLGFPIIGS